MPEDGFGKAGVNGDVDVNLGGGDDRAKDDGVDGMFKLNQDSVVFIVRVWPQQVRRPAGAAASGEMARQCRGVVEHLETRARHHFLTWFELTRHLSRYVPCDELTKPVLARAAWRNILMRLQIWVSHSRSGRQN